MRLVDLGVFAFSFGTSFVVLTLIVRIIHLITHDHTKTYLWGVVSFSLLAAALLTYSNLGR